MLGGGHSWGRAAGDRNRVLGQEHGGQRPGLTLPVARVLTADTAAQQERLQAIAVSPWFQAGEGAAGGAAGLGVGVWASADARARPQERRKRQAEIESKRRQLEDDRRQLQHLKVGPAGRRGAQG